ncbi:bisdemethoxycurcumin synthase-like isoform X1 [Panicum hallii]|uniref:bisdemethoxycurcumin synthase-like isoform X1 n=1 Tax=Panicum hallii TaxID=206008 RepID=UPI000DF4D471|nr:bisdemethoxycurcumin synthase-like isoform X1 [Panicum hallii]
MVLPEFIALRSSSRSQPLRQKTTRRHGSDGGGHPSPSMHCPSTTTHLQDPLLGYHGVKSSASTSTACSRARHWHSQPVELRATGRVRRLVLPRHQERPPHKAQGQDEEDMCDLDVLSFTRLVLQKSWKHCCSNFVEITGYNSGIKQRYFYHTEDTIRDHPEFIDSALPSLGARQAILASAVPELTAAAATRAIAEWGRPAGDVTHLVFATSSDAHMPGADLRLASLLGLRSSVQRTMVYFHGCSSGSAALRVAKDIAENNRSARVLVACAELTVNFFREAHEDRPETLIMQSLFGDGAGAVILGAVATGGRPADSVVERPLFELVSASQTLIPDTEDAAAGQLADGGLVFRPSPRMPGLLRQLIEQYLVEAVAPLGLGGRWNDLFWAVHPGGPAILDSVEAALALAPGKLAASRRVLREYGNMSGVSVIFVLDELRRRRGELAGGFGVMLGLGPGFTVETMVLRAASGAKRKAP